MVDVCEELGLNPNPKHEVVSWHFRVGSVDVQRAWHSSLSPLPPRHHVFDVRLLLEVAMIQFLCSIPSVSCYMISAEMAMQRLFRENERLPFPLALGLI